MRISAISDVHVKAPHDAADKLLLSFLTHPLVMASDYVLLLGDIFDLMAGAHREYLQDYAHLFEAMDKLVKAGKKVYFIEGNHDVHLEKLFSLYWNNGEIRPLQHPVKEVIGGKVYYFSHGDEHDIHNGAYHRYMSFIRTTPLRLVANYVMPYAVLNFVGERASKMSRKKGGRMFDEDKVREKFRSGVEVVMNTESPDFIIGGHSHVKDHVLLSNGKTIYVNNGYATKSCTFIFIHDHHIEFVELP